MWPRSLGGKSDARLQLAVREGETGRPGEGVTLQVTRGECARVPRASARASRGHFEHLLCPRGLASEQQGARRCPASLAAEAGKGRGGLIPWDAGRWLSWPRSRPDWHPQGGETPLVLMAPEGSCPRGEEEERMGARSSVRA